MNFVMSGTETTKGRGRPRRFDREDAVATAQRLFHARGYDAVSVADVTGALGINPPSFYAAFGSKFGLYERILERYDARDAIPFADLLRSDRPVAEALASLLDEAARRYGADPETAGCLVVEGARCLDPKARAAARALSHAAEEAIHAYIAARHPREARQATDFVITTMAGLSAVARNGHRPDQLLATARLAGSALTRMLNG